jgi:hypothetical protein
MWALLEAQIRHRHFLSSSKQAGMANNAKAPSSKPAAIIAVARAKEG